MLKARIQTDRWAKEWNSLTYERPLCEVTPGIRPIVLLKNLRRRSKLAVSEKLFPTGA